MAIYHLSAKAISRSTGRSATAAAAYRSGEKIRDERTGLIHDYTKKSGVKSADIVLPDNAPLWANDRSQLWNAAELAEKRKDACIAKEYEVALPEELPPEERKRLALDFAKWLATNEGCAVDVAIHEPSKNGDNRNHHAHILKTTRKIDHDGMGGKLDSEKAGRNRKADLEIIREKWAALTNQRLKQNGIDATVDHRSLEAQGIDREPTQHLGVAITEIQRRGAASNVVNRIAEADRMQAQASAEIERQEKELNKHIGEVEAELKNLGKDFSKSAMSDFKKQLAEKAQAEKAERDRIQQAEREQIERKAREEAEKKRQTEQQAERERIEAERERSERAKAYIDTLPLKQREQYAEQVLRDFNQQIHKDWRESELEKRSKEAEKLKEKHNALVEPKEPFFRNDKYRHEVSVWASEKQKIERDLYQLDYEIKEIKSSRAEGMLKQQIEQKARESLKKLHPELQQVLTDKAMRIEREREEQKRQKANQQKTKPKNKNQDLER